MDIQYINGFTGLSIEERNDLVLYFKGLPENIQIFIMFDQRITIKKRGEFYSKDKSAEFYYSTFILTIQKVRNIEKSPSKKSKLKNNETHILYLLQKERVKNKSRKTKPMKNDKVLKYKSMILKLKEDGLSWENISDYLYKYYGFKISRDYLFKLFR